MDSELADIKRCLTDITLFIGQECHRNERLSHAEYWYTQALKFDPDNPELHYRMCSLAGEKKDFNAIVAHATKAVGCSNDVDARYQRALALLMLGKYKQGFIDMEARLEFPKTKQQLEKRFGSLPRWNGQDCDVLFVCAEQGYGDIFQFSRYVPLITEKFNVKKVIFEVPKDCAELFAYNFNSDKVEVVALGQPLPAANYYTMLMSLCRLFDTRIGTIPPLKINPQPEYVDKWRDLKGCVGFVLNGRKAGDDIQIAEWNARRSITMEQIMPILDKGIKPYLFEGDTQIKSWSDTAGIMANLDLLISIDTGPVHLGGAMQIPVWLLQHASPCWRWQLEGPHTPWYTENLTQFRQKTDGDWLPVIEDVVERMMDMKRHAA